MKKAFSVFAVFFVILAAGCEKQSKADISPPPAPSQFTSLVSVTYGKTEMTAQLTQNAAEDFTIKFLTPEALAPLLLEYKNSVCKVTYNGLTFEADVNRFPQTEVGALLTGALSDAVQGMNLQTTCENGIWTYTGTGERGTFTLTRNGETGQWIDFNVSGADLKIVFSEFKQ
ncbi:MAG: hypothetical protein IKU08_07270 [Clostridia bacterium]|nr:hypothetical protein [Clostridia bacterium]